MIVSLGIMFWISIGGIIIQAKYKVLEAQFLPFPHAGCPRPPPTGLPPAGNMTSNLTSYWTGSTTAAAASTAWGGTVAGAGFGETGAMTSNLTGFWGGSASEMTSAAMNSFYGNMTTAVHRYATFYRSPDWRLTV